MTPSCALISTDYADKPLVSFLSMFWTPKSSPGPPPISHPSALPLTQVGAVVLELLREFLQVRLTERNDLPTAGLLQHSSVPVISAHGSQQNPVLTLGRGCTSAHVPRGAPGWEAAPHPHHEASTCRLWHLLPSLLIAQLPARILGFNRS